MPSDQEWMPVEPDLETILTRHPRPLDDLASGCIPAVIMRQAFTVSLLIKNLANHHYSSSGFVLFDQQTFQNVAFLYPAEGRYFQTTLDFSF